LESHVTVSRKDGKPLGVDRIVATLGWISAAFDSSAKPEDSSARINVIVRRSFRSACADQRHDTTLEQPGAPAIAEPACDGENPG